MNKKFLLYCHKSEHLRKAERKPVQSFFFYLETICLQVSEVLATSTLYIGKSRLSMA